MTPYADASVQSRLHERRKIKVEYAVIFGSMFVIFLALALAKRVLPANWLSSSDYSGWHDDRAGRKSVIAEAVNEASVHAPFAFMG